MPRMKYNPNIIVVDNGNGIVRTNLEIETSGRLSQDYYPKDLRNLGKPEKTDVASESTNSSENSE